MKLLFLDVETAPNVGHFWGLFNQTISIKQVMASGYTLCWAAKWHDQRKVLFSSIHRDGKAEMIQQVWNLLDEADAICHYNGSRFDVPVLNREFLELGLTPPAPYKQIDLLRTIRSRFKFHSNKLDAVLKQLGMEAKVEHKGHELWTECMAGDPKAWKVMERYNRRDVTIMEGLYTRLLPWIKNHPNYALYTNENRPVCTKCGSAKLLRRGQQRSQVAVYDRYQCKDCGSWQQERKMTPVRNQGWILKEAH